MNRNSATTKTWIWIIIVIVAIVGGYFYFSGSSTSTSTALLQPQAGGASGNIGDQVLSLLNQIRSLKIDDSLFTDPGYQTLQDYSVTIPPVSVGRPDPFAPLPGVSASGAPAGTSATPTH